MSRSRMIAASLVALLFTDLAAAAQPAGNAGPPNNAANPNGAPPPDLDQQCRRQAADQTGYRPGSGNEQAYGSAYYACMDSASNVPPPPPRYYDAPYPYPYPYPYYYGGPYWGGPAVGLSFGFGGWRGRWR